MSSQMNSSPRRFEESLSWHLSWVPHTPASVSPHSWPPSRVTLFLQASLLSLIGCLMRPSEPDEFYKPGTKASVQTSQLVGATILAYVSIATLVVPLMLAYKVPSPHEYAFRLYKYSNGTLRPGQSKDSQAEGTENVKLHA